MLPLLVQDHVDALQHGTFAARMARLCRSAADLGEIGVAEIVELGAHRPLVFSTHREYLGQAGCRGGIDSDRLRPIPGKTLRASMPPVTTPRARQLALLEPRLALLDPSGSVRYRPWAL